VCNINTIPSTKDIFHQGWEVIYFSKYCYTTYSFNEVKKQFIPGYIFVVMVINALSKTISMEKQVFFSHQIVLGKDYRF